MDGRQPRVFLEISAGARVVGKLVFSLFWESCPKTAENFRALCEDRTGYRGAAFHRVIPGFMAQGGDFTAGDGTGGESIYGRTFEDENFTHRHDKRGALSMANAGPNTNGSQFFVLFAPAPHLDNRHVVFGQLEEGWDVLEYIERVPTRRENDCPTVRIEISDCGEMPILGNDQAADRERDEETVAVVEDTCSEYVENVSSQEQETDSNADFRDLSPRQRKLFELRLKMNEARKQNFIEVRKELAGTEKKTYRKDQHSSKNARDFLHVSAAQAKSFGKKDDRKSSQDFAWNMFNPEASYGSHEKRRKKLMEQGPLDESTMEDLDPMNYGHYPKPKEEALNYMVKELTDSQERREKFKRRRQFYAEEDVAHINERNRVFNKKVSRYYDKLNSENL